MSAVNLSNVTELFTKYDLRDAGKLSTKDIANVAYELLTDADTANNDTGSLFATFVLGGKDKTGLLPDFDKDGMVSAKELKTLAAKSGSADRIGSADLQAAFTDNYKEGATIDTKKLADLAGIETPEEPATDTGSLLKQFLPMLLMMMRMFMGGFGGGFGGGYGGGYGQYR